jgi:hypothetical protein
MDPEVNLEVDVETTQPKIKRKNAMMFPSQASHLLIIPLPSFIMHVYLLLKKSAHYNNCYKVANG